MFVYEEGVARLKAIEGDVGVVRLTGTLGFLGCMAFIRWWNELIRDTSLRGVCLDISSFTHALTPAEVSVVAMSMQSQKTPLVVGYVGIKNESQADQTAGAVEDAGRALTASFPTEFQAMRWIRATLHPARDAEFPYAQ